MLSPNHRRLALQRLWRVLLWTLAAVVFVWALADSRFRDQEGFPTGQICLPIAFGFALAALGWTAESRWRKFVCWFVLLLLGQAVSLQLIEAGNLIRYQHYKPLGRLFNQTQPLLLILLLTQTAIVVTGMLRRWSTIRAWLTQHFRIWHLASLGLLFVLSSTALSREVSVYVAEVLFATFVQAVNLGNVVLLAWAFPEDRLPLIKEKVEVFEGSENRGGGKPGYWDRFVVIAAIWVATVAALLSYVVYERHPHVTDEVAYLLQARYLATGVLTLPAPSFPAAFEVYLIEVENGRWYAAPPVGWPAVLAIGVLLGVPWLVNPILAGLNVLLAYALARELYDRFVARWVLLLLCISPWHVLMAINLMTHTLTLTCGLGAALFVVWARRTDSARWMLAAGSLIGLASLVRPLEGLILAGLLGLWSIGAGGRRLKPLSLTTFILSVTVIGALAIPYNKLLTGKPFTNPIMAYTDKHFGIGTNALGFGPNRGWGWALDPFPGHGPLDAAVNANLNFFSMNIELFGWAAGSLLLLALLFFSGTLRKADYLMLTVIAVVFAAHAFYWYSGGPDFGARYWYLMLFPCVVLTARGIQFFVMTLKAGSNSLSYIRVAIAIFSLCTLTLVNYFPWRAIDKYHHYLGMRPDVRYLARQFNFGRSLVLIRGNHYPDYVSAFAYNPLDLNAEAPVYVWDRDSSVTAHVLQAYRERPVWIVNGPSLTGRGYEVVSGPLRAGNLLTSANAHK